MKLDRFLQYFVVKERKFYPLFIQLAELGEEAANHLLSLLQEKDVDTRDKHYKAVKLAEHEADKVANKVYDELKTSFVTPFDREDVNELKNTLDTFIDFMHDAARRVAMYKPQRISDMMIMMGKYIQEDAHILVEIMKNIENLHKKADAITDRCNRVQEIEHACDDLYEDIMSDVFANEKDAIELVKLKNIVQALEDTTDRAKDSIEIVRSILIKFA